MKINDTRNSGEGAKFDDMAPGCVYVDCQGSYVIQTDEECVVNLETGALNTKSWYDVGDVFIPVRARLEIES